MSFLRSIKSWYEAAPLRQRTMLVVTAWVVVFIWFGVVGRQFKTLRTDLTNSKTALAAQQAKLDIAGSTQNELQKVLADFSPSKTYDSNKLTTTVNSFATAAEIQPQLQQLRGTGNDKLFKVNSVDVRFQRVKILPLIKFSHSVEELIPYLKIEDMTLTPDRVNPYLVNVTMKISSLELKTTDVKSALAAAAGH
jgi:hypothetical protein